MKKDIMFIQGNEAIARGAFAAGARFYAGYPITPSSEVAEVASRELPKIGGVYIQMEDEIGSMAAIIGASIAGKKSFTATAGPGFSLMQENLGVAIVMEAPCVIIDIQRGGPSTGLATKVAQGDLMQARYGTHGDHEIIAISPSTIQECYDYTIEAFNLAEEYRTPVVILGDEAVGHMRAKCVLHEPERLVERKQPTCPPEEYLPFSYDENGVAPLAKFGSEYMFRVNSSMHDDTGYATANPEKSEKWVRHLCTKIQNNKKKICKYKKYNLDDAEYVIIAYGCTARSALGAMQILREKGIKAGVLQLITIWPFADFVVKEICEKAKHVLVPELCLGQLIDLVKLATDNKNVTGLNKLGGREITPNEIVSEIEGVLK